MVNIGETDSAAVVMLSCDAYADLWPTAIKNLVSNWEGSGFKLYFVSNKKEINSSQVQNILTGADENWSNSLRIALQQIEEDNIFLLLDDLYLISKPDKKDLFRMLEILSKNNLSTIHFRPVPPNQSMKAGGDWSVYPRGYPYSCNVNALWGKNDLLKVLAYGESAWEFEINGSYRLSRIGDAGHMNEYIFEFLNLVEKGRWTDNIVSLDLKYGIGIDVNSRTKPNRNLRLKNRIITSYFNFCLNKVPYTWRTTLVNKIKKILVSY